MDSKISFPELDEYFEVLEQDKSKYTIRNYELSIRELCQFFKIDSIEKLAKIDYKKLLLFRNNLLHKGLEASTINMNMRNISAFFKYLKKHKYISEDPFELIEYLKEEQKVKKVLSDDECHSLINACVNENEKMIIVTLLATGVRRSELVNIKCGDIDGNKLLVRFGKGKKQRVVPIQSSVIEYIQQYIECHGKNDYLIVSQRGKHQVTPEAVRQTVKKVAERAGINPERIEELSVHDFRRKYATSLLSRGVDSMLVQTALGHKRIETTRRYAQTEIEALEEAINSKQMSII